MKVSEERIDHLLNYFDEYDIEVSSKDDEAKNLHHALVLWLGRVFIENFNTRFATTIGRTIYMPSDEGIDKEALRRASLYVVLRHELIHIIDYIRHPIWYLLSYALILPTLFTMRAYWERRGYTAGLVARKEIGYMLDEYAVANWMEEVFTGKHYFWMALGKQSEQEFWIERTRTVKYTDHLGGYYPYHEDYQAYFKE